MSDDPRATFEWLSNEYAQALQALTAIENQASTIVAFGASEDLRTYVDQFIAMAAQTRDVAVEKEEAHFVEWFNELIRKAEALRVELVRE
ncbi:MAG TPA: hypothetical protein VH087_09130 [Thermoanaerobaculia bacterium]|nr:hypothetical protein [Thermoanaerobaculia bacterium]